MSGVEWQYIAFFKSIKYNYKQGAITANPNTDKETCTKKKKKQEQEKPDTHHCLSASQSLSS